MAKSGSFGWNIRSSRYFIAETSVLCKECNQRTKIYGFVLPAGYELERPIGDEYIGDMYEWTRCDQPALVGMNDLLESVAARMKTLSGNRCCLAQIEMKNGKFWGLVTHCECCGYWQYGGELHDSDNVLFPEERDSASRIVLHEFVEPFACFGACREYSEEVFMWMQRAPSKLMG